MEKDPDKIMEEALTEMEQYYPGYTPDPEYVEKIKECIRGERDFMELVQEIAAQVSDSPEEAAKMLTGIDNLDKIGEIPDGEK